MMLHNFSVPGRPTIRIIVGQRPTVFAVVLVGVVWTYIVFSHSSIISLTPSLWETARYRLKYCLKGPLNPKQTDNQPFAIPEQYTLFLRI